MIRRDRKIWAKPKSDRRESLGDKRVETTVELEGMSQGHTAGFEVAEIAAYGIRRRPIPEPEGQHSPNGACLATTSPKTNNILGSRCRRLRIDSIFEVFSCEALMKRRGHCEE